MPQLEAFTLDALAPALEAVPRVAVPEFPRLPTMPTADLTSVLRETLLPHGPASQLPQVRGVGQSLRFPDLGELVAGPHAGDRRAADQPGARVRRVTAGVPSEGRCRRGRKMTDEVP